MLNVLINFHINCIGQIEKFTFAKNNIEKNVEDRVLFKNYKERFERLLHLWFTLKIATFDPLPKKPIEKIFGTIDYFFLQFLWRCSLNGRTDFDAQYVIRRHLVRVRPYL